MGDASIHEQFGPLKASYNKFSDYLILTTTIDGQAIHLDGKKVIDGLEALVAWLKEQRR